MDTKELKRLLKEVEESKNVDIEFQQLISKVNEIHENTTFSTKDFVIFLSAILFIFTLNFVIIFKIRDL